MHERRMADKDTVRTQPLLPHDIRQDLINRLVFQRERQLQQPLSPRAAQHVAHHAECVVPHAHCRRGRHGCLALLCRH